MYEPFPGPSPQDVPPDHSVKVAHLVFGLFFLGVAGIWALIASEVITVDRLAILAPVVLITAGVIGLAASLANARNRRRRLAARWAAQEAQDLRLAQEPDDRRDVPDATATYPTQQRTTDDTEELR